MKVGKEEMKIRVVSGVKVIRQRTLLDIDIIGLAKVALIFSSIAENLNCYHSWELKPASSFPKKPSLIIVPFIQSL